MNLGVWFESVMHHCIQFSKINWCRVPTLTRIIIFADSYSSLVGVYVLKIYWILQQRNMLYLNFGVGFDSDMHHCIQFSEKDIRGVPTLNMLIIFANSYISLFGVYILKMSWIWQQRNMLYLKFGVRFDYFMHHCIQFSKKYRCGVPTLTRIIIFFETQIAP